MNEYLATYDDDGKAIFFILTPLSFMQPGRTFTKQDLVFVVEKILGVDVQLDRWADDPFPVLALALSLNISTIS